MRTGSVVLVFWYDVVFTIVCFSVTVQHLVPVFEESKEHSSATKFTILYIIYIIFVLYREPLHRHPFFILYSISYLKLSSATLVLSHSDCWYFFLKVLIGKSKTNKIILFLTEEVEQSFYIVQEKEDADLILKAS